ncbi:hypothetical protein [Sphingobium sp. HWE2-09]|uniref:hypothetical protein n=1 Tax=Sphingobium sp. HWE2-09 TaxID=3108390 RepID=UPI002DCBFDB6|nr:hypothetical protein [Sphingobium sp. HWE2-09]
MRLYAALHSYSDNAIREFLNKNMTSAWTKNRLLYPVVYFHVNLPNDNVIEQLLLHVVPKDKHCLYERRLIKFLLEPHLSGAPNLAVRAYIGLLSHPYDALEYLTYEIERYVAQKISVTAEQIGILKSIAEVFPGHRLKQLCDIIDGISLPIAKVPMQILGVKFDKDKDDRKIIEKIIDVSERVEPDLKSASPMMAALVRVRWSRYPDPSDFEELDAFRKRYAVLRCASIVDFVCRSLFLFSRDGDENESLSRLRGTLIFGAITPLSLLAPGGFKAIQTDALPGAVSTATMESFVAEAVGSDGEKRSDRIWINSTNWTLARLQFEGRLNAWSEQARSAFPIWVHPRYLSGLDWGWLDDVLKTVGIMPLRGSAAGIYVLLLRQLEEFLRESVALRLAVEPLARQKSIEDFAEWLFLEFKENSLAFIRIVLTPETIMKLRLADNYTAAISLRIVLLEVSVQKFGFFNNLLSEEVLIQEEEALTATLSRMSIGARQFEIPWASLKIDTNTRVRDTFTAHEAISDAVGDELSLLGQERVSNYPFANGASVEYEVKNIDWPLTMTICQIVETFLTHPTAGIESILSVRIRHDAFRREFANSIGTIKEGIILNVPKASIVEYVKQFERPIYSDIQKWLDAEMHTKRKDKQKALFDLIPDKSSMNGLIEKGRDVSNLDMLIDLVFEWLKVRLEKQLVGVRQSLRDNLAPCLDATIQNEASRLIGLGEDEEDVVRTSQALSSAISRRAIEIEEWFKVPIIARTTSLTAAEIFAAVEERYKAQISRGDLRLRGLPSVVHNQSFGPDKIRHFYDLLSELARNAIKHAGLSAAKLRYFVKDGHVIASNLARSDTVDRQEVQGHPYKTLQDSLFGEGKSGTKKLAYLASSTAREPLVLHFFKRLGSYHVAIPLSAFGLEAGVDS